MILDAECSFNTVTNGVPVAQDLTATAASSNIIDLGGDWDQGVGEPLGVVIDVTTAADATTGDETYQFDIQTDDNSSFSSAATIARRIIAAASLVAGARFVIPLPNDNERYIRVYYTLGGTTPTVSVKAYLQPLNMIENIRYYPDNITIS